MPNCDFYALGADIVEVLDFVFAQPGWCLYELASVPDEPLRVFHATSEVRSAFGEVTKLKQSLHFHLYAKAMGGKVTKRKIVFNPGALPGKTFRYDSEGWGLIQLYLGALRKGRLSPSHTNHNSPTRAANWATGSIAEWDFAEVTRMSSRLNRFVRKLGVAKHGSRPILPVAAAALDAGDLELAGI